MEISEMCRKEQSTHENSQEQEVPGRPDKEPSEAL